MNNNIELKYNTPNQPIKVQVENIKEKRNYEKLKNSFIKHNKLIKSTASVLQMEDL